MYVHEDLSSVDQGNDLYCYLVADGGGVQGPITCTVTGGLGDKFTVTGGYDAGAITFADNLQRPQFILGKSSDFVSMVKLTSVTNVGEHLYELSGVFG